MTSGAPPVSLSELLDRYRSRILQLNRNMLTKVIEELSISPDSTDPEDLKKVERTEWIQRPPRAPPNFPPSVQTPNDIYTLLSDGTSPPLSQEKREELFQHIETALNAQAAPEFRPLQLPEDFRQLCALTDSLEGPGLPISHANQTPDAFNGLSLLLFSLQGMPGFSRGPLSTETLVRDAQLEDDDWEIAAGMQTGDFEGQGGMWLCWSRTEYEGDDKSDSAPWKWRWFGTNDTTSVVYEDVGELVEKFWCQWRGVNAVYGELGYDRIA